MKSVTEALKLELIDYGPTYKGFSPDEIVSATGVLTAKKGSFKEMLKKITKKVKRFHKESTRRGHASLTTTPVIWVWYEGSRIIDFYVTSWSHGSYLIFSSRRIPYDESSIIIPNQINSSKFREEYRSMAIRSLKLYNRLKDSIGIDQARKCLPLGFRSYGFLQLPFQTAIGIIKEAQEEKEYIPEEIKIFSKKLLRMLYNIAPSLTEASLSLPYNTAYPHPNIFSSLKLTPPTSEVEVLDFKAYNVKIPKKLKEKASVTSAKEISKQWKKFIDENKEEVYCKAKMLIPLAVYNELKRHRTVGIKVESIYSAAERALNSFSGDENRWIFVPSNLKAKDREKWLNLAKDQLSLYKKMIENGIERHEALYVIPHSLKLVATISLNGYHLFDPFGFLGVRTCATADKEFVKKAWLLINELYKLSPDLASLMGPKCKLGYCPERNFCGVIKKYNPTYDEELHKKIDEEFVKK